jgi:hypothetical protein
MERLRIYQYECGYNDWDWCFVRLPPHYDPQGPPHPFVVCNHGNGWKMDGSEAKANFSAKTQFGVDPQNGGAYLNENVPGYRKYSSPLIESFLAKGYVVCGAQNGGDQLYGNDRCRYACAAFFRHMTETYNIRKSGFIIGASNGFMTALNVFPLLSPGSAAGLIGLYPLCNLSHAFMHTHREGIMKAYGLNAGNLREFQEKCRAYDPCSEEWFGYQLPPDSFPPVLLIWSSTDHVLPMDRHAVRFARLLRERGIHASDIQIDAAGSSDRASAECPHGDWRHFQTDSIIAWCETVGKNGNRPS